MIAFRIDIIPDVHVRTPFAERALGNDEVRIIGGWRNWFSGTLVATQEIESGTTLEVARTRYTRGSRIPGGAVPCSRSALGFKARWLAVQKHPRAV